MKPTLIITLEAFILLISLSCNQPNHISAKTSTSLYASSFHNNEKETTIMIYDLGKGGYELELKAVPVKIQSEELLQSVVEVFINYNQFKVQQFDIKLDKQANSNETTLLFFTGSPKFNTYKQFSVFWKAMDITLARNFKMKRYELYFNNNIIKI